MKRIASCLWFDSQAEAAAEFYVSLFKNSKILQTTHYGASGPGPNGSVMTVRFQLDGQEYIALNGGPVVRFNEAVSFVVKCETQKELDALWQKLVESGGSEVQCGWLKDKFGVSWQILPAALDDLMDDADPGARDRVMKALLAMNKLDLAELERAHAGPGAAKAKPSKRKR
jgi:predicted 3-demethylubiquinone-9 3-methyltransferase (glyoxalase superfamily)